MFQFIDYLFPRLSAFLSPCVIILILLILQIVFFHDIKKTVLYIVFSMYLVVLFRLTGLPDSLHMHFHPRLQLIPIKGMKEDAFNAILNVCLFIPFGFFLPALWRKFFSFKTTVLAAFAMTCFIEFTQLFCSRLTDVNDIITNTLGAVIGFFFFWVFTKMFPTLFQNKFKRRECLLIFTITFTIVFYLDPVIYNFLKDLQSLPT